MEPVTTSAAALTAVGKAAPIAARELKRLWRRNELRNPRSEIKKRLDKDPRLEKAQRKLAKSRVAKLDRDAELGALLKQLLDGDVGVLEEVRRRAGANLRYTDDDQVHVVIVSAFCDALDRSIVPAKRDDRSALNASTRLVQTTLAEQDQRRGIEAAEIQAAIAQHAAQSDAVNARGRADLEERLRDGGRLISSRGALLALTTASVRETTSELLTELDAHARPVAEEAAQWLAEGPDALVAWTEAEPAVLNDARERTWRLLGRVLIEEARFAAAEQAFLAASRTVGADVARGLVAAGVAAVLAGDLGRMRKLQERAG